MSGQSPYSEGMRPLEPNLYLPQIDQCPLGSGGSPFADQFQEMARRIQGQSAEDQALRALYEELGQEPALPAPAAPAVSSAHAPTA